MTKRGSNSPTFGNAGLQVEPGDISKITVFGQTLMTLPKIDIHNAAQLEQRINDYFSMCVETDMKPAVVGLSLALGLDRRRLWEISRDVRTNHIPVRDIPNDCRELIKKAYTMLEFGWETLTMNFGMHPTAAVFLGINNFGYSDVKQISVEQQIPRYDPLGEITDMETLKQRYLSAIPDEPDDE